MTIGIVVDSTVDLPVDILSRYHIRRVPLKIIWGDEEFTDRISLSSDDFFLRLRKSSINPRSSAPAAGDFLKAYQQLLNEGVDMVISLHLSSRLSGTVQAANLAAGMLATSKIKVLDSLSASVGSGILLMKILERIDQGASWPEIEALYKLWRDKLNVYLIVDDLQYLYRGGRIGRAQVIVGEFLNVKPMLALVNGEVVPEAKIYGKKNIASYLDSMFTRWEKDGRTLDYIAFAYSLDEDSIAPLLDLAAHHYPDAHLLNVQVSPVIGCHVGPGLIGFAVL